MLGSSSVWLCLVVKRICAHPCMSVRMKVNMHGRIWMHALTYVFMCVCMPFMQILYACVITLTDVYTNAFMNMCVYIFIHVLQLCVYMGATFHALSKNVLQGRRLARMYGGGVFAVCRCVPLWCHAPFFYNYACICACYTYARAVLIITHEIDTAM